MEPVISLRKPGRPLSFDREQALHQAMLLFWQFGYEATSVAQLTEAMGITPPSLYTAFGDKKRLYLEALHRYTHGPVTAQSIIASAATGYQAARLLLQSAAVGLTGESTPAGCMLVMSATNCSPGSADVQAAAMALRQEIELALRTKIEAEHTVDQSTADPQPALLAAFVMTVIQGMSIQARDGVTREQLKAIAKQALTGWPRNRKRRGD